MKAPTRIPRLALRAVPASRRDRYREEWQADLADAHELGLDPRTIRRGALRTAFSLRKEHLMSSTLSHLSARRSAAQIALFVPTAIIAVIIAFAGAPWIAMCLVIIALSAQILSHRLALAVAARLGSERLPWLLYAGVLACTVIIAAALLEVNALFAANDLGGSAPAGLTTLMLATGIVGTAAAIATAGAALGTGVALLRRRQGTA